MSSIAKFNVRNFNSTEIGGEAILVLSKFTKFTDNNGVGTRIFYNVFEDNSVAQITVTESATSVQSTYDLKTVDVGLPLFVLESNGEKVNRQVTIDTANIFYILPSPSGVGSIVKYYDQNNIALYAHVHEGLDAIIALAQGQMNTVLSVNGVGPDVNGNVYLGGENYFPVMATGTPTQNASALFDQYNLAVSSTPNGAAKSVTNRAVVVLSPGIYNLGVTSFLLGAEFVDLVGLTGNPSDVVITGGFGGTNGGTISKTSDDNVISGITVELVGAPDDDRAAIYTPDAANFANEVWKNIILTGTGNPTNVKGIFDGTYENVTSSSSLFGSLAASECNGTFISCKGGANSFAAAGTIGATANLYFNVAGADSYATDGGSVHVSASLQYNVLNRGKATDQP